MGVREENAELTILKVSDISSRPPEQQWLIRPLWGRTAVGIIGGAPKCCKSWLGLDIATSVASRTPCLGQFPVDRQGPVLIFLAEDSLPMVRSRISSICRSRNLDIESLDLYAITTPVLRLDHPRDQELLKTAIERLRPCLLLLDPLVRIHRLDENSASEISGLLGYLRELQRTFDLAVIVVHHTGKRRRSQPGQSLRGSSDLHAFGDSNAYLASRQNRIILTVEHRDAGVPEPIPLELVTDQDGLSVHLEVRAGDEPQDRFQQLALEEALVELLTESPVPLTRTALRARLKVNNKRLGDALTLLRQLGHIERRPKGWIVSRREKCSVFQT